jgi:GAF domain-containing protein
VLALEQKRATQLALVGEIAARAAAFGDPDAILRTLVKLVQERFSYPHVCVALYDPARQELELRAVAGATASSYTLGERWPASRGLLGLAAQTRRTVVSADIHKDTRLPPESGIAHGTAAELCVPLISGQSVLGVLDVESGEPDAFDENDVVAMETLANQSAAALEKARSLQTERQRAGQLALVNQIASRTARLMPTGRLLHEAVELIYAQFGYFNVAVFLHEAEPPGLRLAANAGALQETLRADKVLTTGIISHVGASGITYLCLDTRLDPYYASPFPSSTADPVQTELAIPLRRGDHVIGVLDILSEASNAFGPSDITALEALADQLAAALENARLFESEAQRVAQLDAVRVFALRLTAERDLDTLLHSIVVSAAELVQADGVTFYIADETRGDLVVQISHELPRNHVGYRLRFGEGLAGRVAARGEPAIIPDYSTWEGRSPIFEGEPLHGIMSVPLKWQNRVLGVLNLHRRKARAEFNQEELRLANLFAAQAAVAIETARLVNALQDGLRAQQTLTDLSGTLLETTDPQAIIDQAAAAALRALSSETVVIFLPDEEGQLAARAHAGIVPATLLILHLPPDASSIPGTAYSTRRPLLWSEADSALMGQAHAMADRIGFRAGISVPMLVGDHVVGVVTVNTHHERHYDQADVQTLSLLANQTASALERARYFDQVQRRARELNLLFEGYRATAFTLDPDQLITRLLEQLVNALDLTSAYFVQVDPTAATALWTHEYFSEHAHPDERRIGSRSWSFGRFHENELVFARQPHVSQRADPTLPPETKAHMEQYRVHTVLRVPVVAAEQVIGYVSLWETRAPRAWTVDEMRFAETMAAQAAAALVNARLYQAAHARTRELQALHAASRQLNASLDIRTICENSVDSLRDILGYHHVSIYFIEGESLRLQVQRGYESVLDNIPLDRGVMARAVTTGEIAYLPDVAQEPGFLAAMPGIQSEIAVPLQLGDRVLGVLNIETLRVETAQPRKEQLTPADVQLLSTFSNQLVVAIENARLFQETQQRLAEVRTLHAASQALNADLELDAVLERIARQFVEALDVDFCTLLEWDRTRDEMVVLFDLDPEPTAHVRVGERFGLAKDAVYREIVARRVPLAYRTDDATLEGGVLADSDLYLWKSQLVVPVIYKGQLTGILELGDRANVRSFSPDEIRLAESLASQAAVSLENARLYRTARSQLQETETLYHFASQLGGTLDVRELGQRALESAARLVEFDFGEVSLLRSSDGALIPLVATSLPGVSPAELALPHGLGVTGWVAENGRAVRLGDVTRDPRYQPIALEIRSEICVPLRVGERVVGVLNLESNTTDAFDAHAEELMTVFAQQLAIGIENARLYEQTKRDAEVKAALLRELSHRVKNNLAAITSLLYLALDEPPETREQILNETLGRVQSMAIAHALLARSSEAHVNLLELGRQVLNDTVRNLSHPATPIEIRVGGDRVQVAARQTTTLALVLNELATNALRHGINGREPGELVLRFSASQLGRQVEFVLEDNGAGLPQEFELNTSAGLGLNLVRTLVEKDLHGQFALERRAHWTSAQVRFQLEEDGG